jgi:hypothetical protein
MRRDGGRSIPQDFGLPPPRGLAKGLPIANLSAPSRVLSTRLSIIRAKRSGGGYINRKQFASVARPRSPTIRLGPIDQRERKHRMATPAAVLAGVTMALAMMMGGSAASQSAPPRSEAPNAAALLEDMLPEVQAIGRQMYLIGACDARIERGEVNPHREVIVAGDPADRKALVRRSYEIFTELYVNGRTQAAQLNYDSAQCQRLLDSGAASILTARLARRHR